MLQSLFALVLASLLGAAMGLQREVSGKSAGFRTYALVALGACAFTILSRTAFVPPMMGAFDPSRIAAQVVVGIGFIGAGLIFVRGGHVEGLTTASGLWVAAAVGMSVGAAQYAIAIITTAIAFLLLSVGKKLQPESWWNRQNGNSSRTRT